MYPRKEIKPDVILCPPKRFFCEKKTFRYGTLFRSSDRTANLFLFGYFPWNFTAPPLHAVLLSLLFHPRGFPPPLHVRRNRGSPSAEETTILYSNDLISQKDQGSITLDFVDTARILKLTVQVCFIDRFGSG